MRKHASDAADELPKYSEFWPEAWSWPLILIMVPIPVMLPGESVVPETSVCVFDPGSVGDSLFCSNVCSPSGMSDPRSPTRVARTSIVPVASLLTEVCGSTDSGSAR